MTRAQLIERIIFAVDGFRFGEWSRGEACGRIVDLIESHPEAVA